METKKATEKQKCNTCKKGLSNTQKGIVLFSFIFFFFTIYGLYKGFQLIFNLF